jgi:hypothetical protein
MSSASCARKRAHRDITEGPVRSIIETRDWGMELLECGHLQMGFPQPGKVVPKFRRCVMCKPSFGFVRLFVLDTKLWWERTYPRVLGLVARTFAAIKRDLRRRWRNRSKASRKRAREESLAWCRSMEDGLDGFTGPMAWSSVSPSATKWAAQYRFRKMANDWYRRSMEEGVQC